MSPRLVVAGWTAAALAAVLTGAVVAGAVSVGGAVAGLAVELAGVATVGAVLLAALLPPGRETAPVARRAFRTAVVAAAAWLVAALLAVGFGAAAAVDRPLPQLDAGTALRWVQDLAVGRGLAVTGACAVTVGVCAGLLAAGRPGPPVVAVLGVALLGTIPGPMTGHAAGGSAHQLAVVSAALHVIAVAVWVGGLAAILTLSCGRWVLCGVLLRRFAPVATGCLAVVAVTGVLNAVVRVPSLGALFGTGYGAVVLAKLTGLLVIGGIGLLLRRRLAAGARPRALAAVEVGVMAATLGLAAALAAASP